MQLPRLILLVRLKQESANISIQAGERITFTHTLGANQQRHDSNTFKDLRRNIFRFEHLVGVGWVQQILQERLFVYHNLVRAAKRQLLGEQRLEELSVPALLRLAHTTGKIAQCLDVTSHWLGHHEFSLK
jgi:hypothetical protein